MRLLREFGLSGNQNGDSKSLSGPQDEEDS